MATKAFTRVKVIYDDVGMSVKYCHVMFVFFMSVSYTSSTIMELGNIGTCLVCSVHPSVHTPAFLHGGWLDFLHIWYHRQIPWPADEYNLEFGSVPNLSDYIYV